MTEIESLKKISKKEKKSKKKKKKEVKDEKEKVETSKVDKKKRKRSKDDDTDEEKNTINHIQEQPETTEMIVDKDDDKKGASDEKEKKKAMTKEERKAKKAAKKAEKEELLSKVPEKDEHGIAYTKIQIKRMLKRVKRGLNPIPTEQEERERIRQMKLEKQEEEKELAGMFYSKENEGKSDDEHQKDVDMANDDDDDEADNIEDEKEEEEEGGEDKTENKKENSYDNVPRPKKKARTKPVPSDYICMACNNKNQPLHWIYDCPDKIYKPGTNKLKKRLRGIHDPASRKVFISGLPFDVKTKEVEMYFEKEMKCGKVVQCKLLQFEDTKRCKGTGFLTFETDEGAKKALSLNGTVLALPEKDEKDKKKKSSGNQKQQKELRLGVKKLLNRVVTKRGNK